MTWIEFQRLAESQSKPTQASSVKRIGGIGAANNYVKLSSFSHEKLVASCGSLQSL
jgi:hypothetical protein